MNPYDIPTFNIKDYHSKFESKGKLLQYATISRLIKKQQSEVFGLVLSGNLPDINRPFLKEDEYPIVIKFFEIYDDYIRTIDKIRKI